MDKSIQHVTDLQIVWERYESSCNKAIGNNYEGDEALMTLCGYYKHALSALFKIASV